MWKIFVGFLIFAALGMFVIFKGGDKLDMAGEAGASSHEVVNEPPASAPAPAASAASAAGVASAP